MRAGPQMNQVAARTDWGTPQNVFAPLHAEFGFELDVCASHENRKCDFYYSIADDGLTRDWGRYVCWMNPPYGPAIGKWMEKAYNASLRGATVVCLVPARTDSRWWHSYAEKAAERRFVKGRIVFEGARWNAPFPSAIIVFRPASQLSAVA